MNELFPIVVVKKAELNLLMGLEKRQTTIEIKFLLLIYSRLSNFGIILIHSNEWFGLFELDSFS